MARPRTAFGDTRIGARIEVVNESGGAPLDGVIGSMTLPLVPGASSAADA